ncbi:MAG: polysaccharide deacetylase family protein [Candidatus Eisenbacteria bacterium]
MRVVLTAHGTDPRDEQSRWVLGQMLQVLGLAVGGRPEGDEPYLSIAYGAEGADAPGGAPLVFIPKHERAASEGGRLPDPVEVYDRDGDTFLAFPPFDALPHGEALWRDRRGGVAAVREGAWPNRVRFAFDLALPARRLLSRREEKEGPRDILDRYRPESSWLAEWDLFGEPVVDRLGSMLRAAIESALVGAGMAMVRLLPWPRGEQFAVSLSHDQDQSLRWERRLARHGLQALRGGTGGRRKGLRLALRDLRDGAVSPTLLSERILRWEGDHDIRSTFFFLAVDKDRFDRRYRVESPPFRRFLRDLAERGFAVGLHGGLDSYLSADTLRRERAKVEESVGREIAGVRQHYIRLRVPETWAAQRQAGFRYDASLGYPDTPGFRGGTSFPFSPFGIEDFVEIPLHGMDRALVAEGITNHGAWDIWSAPARRVGGLLDILWHPYFTDTDLGEEREHQLRGLLAWMAGWRGEAWIATLDEVAAWWNARRRAASAGAWRAAGRTFVRHRFEEGVAAATLTPAPTASDIRIESAEGLKAEVFAGPAGPRVSIRDAGTGAEIVLSLRPRKNGRTR